MQACDPLGQVEFAVLAAVHRGARRSRRSTRQIPGPRERPAGEAVLHEALRRC